MINRPFHTHAPSDEYGQLCRHGQCRGRPVMAVVATLCKGYDLDYVWRQASPGPHKSAADYYLQASENGGEPPGRWGPGAAALGFAQGQLVEREPDDLLFGERKGPDGTPLGRPPVGGQAAEQIFEQLMAASRTRRRSGGGSCGLRRRRGRGAARCIST